VYVVVGTEKPLTGNRCLCRACGQYFNSPSAFDRHLSGPAAARVCLNPADAGMVRNGAGFWVTERMPLRGEPKWAVSRLGNRKTGAFGPESTPALPREKTA